MIKESFRGSIPADRRYDTRYDMWVSGDGRGVVIGATAFGLHQSGKIIAFTAKPCGAEIQAGRGLGTVECAKTVLAVHAPLSFALETANEAAEEHPRIINDDPYGAGWMARGRPLAWETEASALVDAVAYAAHVRAMDPGAEISIVESSA